MAYFLVFSSLNSQIVHGCTYNYYEFVLKQEKKKTKNKNMVILGLFLELQEVSFYRAPSTVSTVYCMCIMCYNLTE